MKISSFVFGFIFIIFLSKEFILVNEEFFVILAFGLFVCFVYLSISSLLSSFLDDRIAEIRSTFETELQRRRIMFSIIQKSEVDERNFVNILVIFFTLFQHARKQTLVDARLRKFHRFLVQLELQQIIRAAEACYGDGW